MPVHAPAPRLCRRLPLRFALRLVRRGRRAVTATLRMGGLIDLLVVVTVFLLLRFYAPAESCLCARVGPLPLAQTTWALEDVPGVRLEGGKLTVDGAAAGDTRALASAAAPELIDALFDVLFEERHRALASALERPTVTDAIDLELPLDAPAVVVKSVTMTAARAGFTRVSFRVNPLPVRSRDRRP